MNKLSRRDAERKIRTLEAQRDTALRVMRLWVYLSIAAVITILFSRLLLGVAYLVLFTALTFITSRRLRASSAQP